MSAAGWIVIVVVAVLALWTIWAFNRLVKYRNRAEEGWAQIDVQLRRRYDLIPNLVQTVEGYAAHERETFEEVTAARSRAESAQGVAGQADAENAVSSGLRQLLAVAENYPDLKANANFLALQEELTGTESKIAEGCADFCRRIGKTPVVVGGSAGFIVNRLLVPYLLDAIRAYEHGLGTLEDIDKGMKLGCGYPMGPFTLLDFVGLDTTKSIADIMFDEYRERRFAAPPTLRKMVAAGFFGQKSGRGFYDYSGEKPVAVDPGL